MDYRIDLVGARGFEPPTTCTPCKYATRLRYAPKARIIAEGASDMKNILAKNPLMRMCFVDSRQARPILWTRPPLSGGALFKRQICSLRFNPSDRP